MGCDIHSYLEIVHTGEGRDKPYVDCFGHVRIGRDYLLFTLMAGVRGEPTDALFQPRGLPGNPRDMSYDVMKDYCLHVHQSHNEDEDDENGCSAKRAEGWVKEGSSEWVDDEKKWVTNPDWHSASWLTLEELEEVQRAYVKAVSKYNYSEVFKLEEKIAKEPQWKNLLVHSIKQMRIEPHRNLEAVIGAMRGLRTFGAEPRLVFWFDN